MRASIVLSLILLGSISTPSVAEIAVPIAGDEHVVAALPISSATTYVVVAKSDAMGSRVFRVDNGTLVRTTSLADIRVSQARVVDNGRVLLAGASTSNPLVFRLYKVGETYSRDLKLKHEVVGDDEASVVDFGRNSTWWAKVTPISAVAARLLVGPIGSTTVSYDLTLTTEDGSTAEGSGTDPFGDENSEILDVRILRDTFHPKVAVLFNGLTFIESPDDSPQALALLAPSRGPATQLASAPSSGVLWILNPGGVDAYTIPVAPPASSRVSEPIRSYTSEEIGFSPGYLQALEDGRVAVASVGPDAKLRLASQTSLSTSSPVQVSGASEIAVVPDGSAVLWVSPPSDRRVVGASTEGVVNTTAIP